ncbi:DUF308 domain-containing protein [Fimbriiglobus ruber]|uniref:DUF308 domain-containing protein n=1 Tax=Fimbriiglobus ruber TaxID=1908690 RepID=UPI00117A31F6|nr:DUF308 domain-containing protein [Fimbriiglobus ruber]
MTSPDNIPDLSDDLLVYKFDKKCGTVGTKWDFCRAVVVDRGNETVHFWNCHTPRTFFALRAQRLISCRFDEILAVYRGRTRNTEWADVVTPTGKAHIVRIEAAEEFDELCRQLLVLAPNDLRAPAEEHPLIALVYVAGGLGGMLPFLYLMPKDSGTAEMILAGLLGIVSGIAGVYWTARLCHRWFGVKLALPFGLGIVGALAGVFVFFKVVCSFVEGNDIHLTILLVAGFLAGATAGVVREKRKSRRRDVPDRMKSPPAQHG